MVARGRIDKRQAILDAAFGVFACRGYDDASVQDVADEAAVSKQTVYNHFEDKKHLFAEAMAATADAVLADNLAVVEDLRDPGPDLRATLDDVARRLVAICCDSRSRALRHLTYGQVARFPDLIGLVQGRTADRLGPAVADRIARLSLSGLLRACDPDLAAEQFLALLAAPAETRSRMGTRNVPESDLDTVAAAAVDTFLRAYGAEPAVNGGRARTRAPRG